MQKNTRTTRPGQPARRAFGSTATIAALSAVTALAACGGGESAGQLASLTSATSTAADASVPGDAGNTNAATTSATATDFSATDVSALDLLPVYQLAPVTLEAPSSVDADGLEASGRAAPLSMTVSAQAAALDTTQAVPDELKSRLASLSRPGTVSAQGSQVRAEATGGTVATVYTPAQVRAAYGFAQLPAQTAANRGAYQGSGQTIYLVDAYHNPNIANDLAVFNQTFGLPGCTALAVPATAALPLAAPAAGSGCSLAVVYAAKGSTTAAPTGALTATAPAINKSWVTEISLDVEWAHAIAPLARIVLVEAQSSAVPDLMAAVALANRMGPGIVSMSFGAAEFAYSSMQFWGAPLAAAGMSYVAASGDGGSQVNWPAVDAHVLAVGGTTLAWNGAVRSETVWTSTGGAISKQVPVPSYQASITKPGDPTSTSAPRFRGTSDVAFNANPYSGQYTYVTPSSATGGAGWVSAGGTSLAAPQWAGLLAVGNAVRAAGGKAGLGLVQTKLYGNIAAVPGSYASSFTDVTSGSNGSCGAMCTARSGYDLPTGLGSPNSVNLLNALSSL